MKLVTRDTDYAIRALACICRARGELVCVSELSRKLKVPRPFLRKILQILKKNSILKSYKGKSGGFTLNISPDEITVFRLMNIFQGRVRLIEHVFKGKACPQIELCYFKKRLDVIESRVAKGLQSITIAKILKNENVN